MENMNLFIYKIMKKMKSPIFLMFLILELTEVIYCNEVNVKVGDQIKMCCGLEFDKVHGLVIEANSIRLKILHNDKISDVEMSDFVQKYSDFSDVSIELIESKLCLTKPQASLANDNFKIQCKVIKNGVSTTLSKEDITLRVYEELKFTNQFPEIMNVSIGTNKTILCQASGGPDLKVLWRKENEGKVSEGESSANLYIINITPEMNQLKYTCEASKSIPKNALDSIINQSVTLNVLFKPELYVDMSAIHTDLGITEIVNITVKGNPRPKLNCDVLDIKVDRNMAISNPSPFTYLFAMEIQNITQKHIGDYICKAENSEGDVTKKISISLEPANVKIVDSNTKLFSDYILMMWSLNSKSVIKNVTFTIETVNNNTLATKTVVLDEEELGKCEKSPPAERKNNWKRTYIHPLVNLTSNSKYKIYLKVCNKHGCVDTKTPSNFATLIDDGKNKFNPNLGIHLDVNGNSAERLLPIMRPSWRYMVLPSTTMFLLPLVVQQLL